MLVVAGGLKAELLNGYEVAVCDNPCNHCVRQCCDPNARVSGKADEQGRYGCEEQTEVTGTLMISPDQLEVELASNTACDKQCDKQPKG